MSSSEGVGGFRPTEGVGPTSFGGRAEKPVPPGVGDVMGKIADFATRAFQGLSYSGTFTPGRSDFADSKQFDKSRQTGARASDLASQAKKFTGKVFNPNIPGHEGVHAPGFPDPSSKLTGSYQKFLNNRFPGIGTK